MNLESATAIAKDLICYHEKIGVSSDWNTYSEDELINGYYIPIVVLLNTIRRNNKKELIPLFVEELFRYVDRLIPHHQQNQRVIDFLSRFSESYSNQFPDESNTINIIEEIKKNLNIDTTTQEKPIRGVAVGDCLMTDIRTFLRPLSAERKIRCDLDCLYFGAAQGGKIPTESVMALLKERNANFLALSFFSYDGLPIYRIIKNSAHKLPTKEIEDYIDNALITIQKFIEEIRKFSNIPILIHNTSGLPYSKKHRLLKNIGLGTPLKKTLGIINTKIEEMVKNFPKTILINEYEVVEKNGSSLCEESIVPSTVSKKAFFHRRRLGYFLSESYLDVIEALKHLEKTKLLLVDFDNTLWQGVMGDGDVQHFLERQKLLKDLKEQGIILVAVSKNTATNIRWGEMLLKEEDFALLKINWNSKSQSVSEVAKILNLGTNSFVFLDDNPVEREIVSMSHPDVLCLDPNQEQTWQWLRWMFSFPCTAETDESRLRTEMYRNQAMRNIVIQEAGHDNEKIMKSLNLHLNFRLARVSDTARCLELSQRTNQFNTTTIRYSKESIQQLIKQENNKKIFVGEMSDKFGNLGVVIMAVVEEHSDHFLIENFVMSCRAMGFGLESRFITEVIHFYDADKQWIGKFTPTDRNSPASTFFADHGFSKSDDGILSLCNRSDLAKAPDWFTIK